MYFWCLFWVFGCNWVLINNKLFTSKLQLETTWALLYRFAVVFKWCTAVQKYLLNFILVKLVGIIISLLKSAFLKYSVGIILELPDYVHGAKFSYLPEETVLSLVVKVSSDRCGCEALNCSVPLLAKRLSQDRFHCSLFRSCITLSCLGTLVQL